MIILYSILGFRDFNKRHDIVERIKRSARFQANLERINETNFLLLYQSKEQNLWFFASNLSVYIVLDDIAYEKLFLEYQGTFNDFSIEEIKFDPPGFHGKGVTKFFIRTREKVLGFYISLNQFPTEQSLKDALISTIKAATQG